jgi:hypothetical protein
MEFGSAADWAAVVVGFCAIVISVVTVTQTTRVTRQTLFTQIHAELSSPEAAEGRRLIYLSRAEHWSEADIARFHKRRPGDWDRVNYAITIWNTLAQYSRHRLVRRNIADRFWGDTVTEAWSGVEPFIHYRRHIGRPDKWSSLVWFAHRNGASVPEALRR